MRDLKDLIAQLIITNIIYLSLLKSKSVSFIQGWQGHLHSHSLYYLLILSPLFHSLTHIYSNWSESRARRHLLTLLDIQYQRSQFFNSSRCQLHHQTFHLPNQECSSRELPFAERQTCTETLTPADILMLTPAHIPILTPAHI